MQQLSKVCDAADWFDPELAEVIQQELEEMPRLHRKQWEFAMIFLTLQKFGLLQAGKTGLSVGGGTERVLYSIARRVEKLFVTDLYEEQTSWDCARTADPDQFIKANKPFAVDDARLQALRMDMRQLEFPDNHFDFCYSSCAVEHIGEYEDFLRHLNEVFRVLKEGGIYVFTTEFHFGSETIKDRHNYVFSAGYLNRLISECPLWPAAQVNAEITPNSINYPLPANLKELCFQEDGHISQSLLSSCPHVQLLRGKYPLTSILLILQKISKPTREKTVIFPGRDVSRRFLETGINEYRRWLDHFFVTINPFSGMGKSRFFADHAEFFSATPNAPAEGNTIFHSDYFWLGSGRKYFRVNFSGVSQTAIVQIRIHSFETLTSAEVCCEKEIQWELYPEEPYSGQIAINVNDERCYAILGKIVSGNPRFSNIRITCSSIEENIKIFSSPEVFSEPDVR